MTDLVHTFEALLVHYGVAALFLTVTLETLGAPLPGESALIAAAAAAARGAFPIEAVVAAAFAGSVLGDNIGYLIGRRLGRGAVLRYGGRVGITEAAMTKAEAITARWGPMMVVVARFVVLLRQLNGIVAGTTGMSWPRFIVANLAGAALWVGLWTSLAYRFGHDVRIVPAVLHHLSLVAMILVPLLIAGLLLLHRRQRRA